MMFSEPSEFGLVMASDAMDLVLVKQNSISSVQLWMASNAIVQPVN
jgi:hypothetical protein